MLLPVVASLPNSHSNSSGLCGTRISPTRACRRRASRWSNSSRVTRAPPQGPANGRTAGPRRPLRVRTVGCMPLRRIPDVVYDGAALQGTLRREPTVPGSRDWPGQPDAPDTPRQLRPERFDETRPADRLAADDHPARWSRDDLRHRLERLPPGHPSSPQSDARDLSSPEENTESDRQADAVERGFWSEVPRFLRAWADHVLRWPAERVSAAVDRSRDPADSWRGDGNQYLNPEQHAQAKEEIIRVRRREEALTEHMGEAERENSCGGWLEGLEHRRKGDDRLKEKIAEQLSTNLVGRSTEEIVRQIQ